MVTSQGAELKSIMTSRKVTNWGREVERNMYLCYFANCGKTRKNPTKLTVHHPWNIIFLPFSVGLSTLFALTWTIFQPLEGPDLPIRTNLHWNLPRSGSLDKIPEFEVRPGTIRTEIAKWRPDKNPIFGIRLFRWLIWVEGGLDQKPENTKAQQAFTQKLWDFVGTSNACISIKSLSQMSHFPCQSYASTLPSDYFHFWFTMSQKKVTTRDVSRLIFAFLCTLLTLTMARKSYYCDCERYCGGRRTRVSYTTYSRHEPHRDLLTAIPQTPVAAHSGPAAVTPAISTAVACTSAVAPTSTVAGSSNQAALSLTVPTPTNIKVCLALKGSALTPFITDSVCLSRLPYPSPQASFGLPKMGSNLAPQNLVGQQELRISANSVSLYPQPPTSINSDLLAAQAMLPQPPPNTTDGLICLLSGPLDDFLKYSRQEQSKWLIDIAHDICDLASLRGSLFIWNVSASACSSGVLSLLRNRLPRQPTSITSQLESLSACRRWAFVLANPSPQRRDMRAPWPIVSSTVMECAGRRGLGTRL